MTRRLVVTAILSLILASRQGGAQLPHFNAGDILRADQLNAIVDRVNAQPVTLTVDCAAGETIGQALEQASPGAIIQVTGTCNETVTITTDGLTLDGQGITTVDGAGQTVITIEGVRRVTIKGLTVQHGLDGLRAQGGAAVILQGVTAADNTEDGIGIRENSTARITDCTVQRSGRDSLRAVSSSSMTFTGTIVGNDNGRDGIHVTGDSSVLDSNGANITTNNNVRDGIAVVSHSSFVVSVSGTTLVAQNNNRFGAEVSGTSFFFLGTGTTLTASGNGTTGRFSGGIGVFTNANFSASSTGSGATLTVQDNLDRGITVTGLSALQVGAGTVTIQRNATIGLQAFEGARVDFQGTTLAAQISQNGGNGVNVNRNASLRFSGATAGSVTVSGNTARGILLINDAYGKLTNITVQNNGTIGIDASDTSLGLSTSIISGNHGSSDVALSFGTRATLNGNTIGTITCDGTVLSQGSTVCPP